MKPRSVVIQTSSRNRQEYARGLYTPWNNSATSASWSSLQDIISDDVPRPVPSSPVGGKDARRYGFKKKFVREPKAHSYTKRVLIYPVGSYSYVFGSNPQVYPRYWFEQSGPGVSYDVATQGSISSLITRANAHIRGKFFKKLKNSELDLAITAAERSKTKVMIARKAAVLLNIKRFAKAFWKRVRARSIHQHESIAKALANAWLEFVYGWKQLANDIFGIATFTASRSMNRWIKTRSAMGDRFDRSRTDASTGLRIIAIEEVSVISEMKVKLNVTADPVLDLTRLMTLNPAAIAWELLPFSFVFDWILNISKYLSELQTRAMFSCSLSGGYLTHVERHVLTGEIPAQDTKGSYQSYRVPNSIKWRDTWTKKTRSILTEAPFPQFPSLRCPTDLEQALTTLTLIVQRLSPKGLGRSGRYM